MMWRSRQVKSLLEVFFRPRPPVADSESLATFIDENAAFLVQKGIYEYSRARAGHYSKVLFAEQEFRQASERSRWQAYPLGLAMIAELVEGVIAARVDTERSRLLVPLRAHTLSVFARYPIPAPLGQEAWSDAREELARRLEMIGMHPPKRAMDIPEPYAKAYFDLMPIHAKLRASEFPTIRNYLRVTLCNMHEELSRRIDAPAVAECLLSQGGDPPATETTRPGSD
jgi:hypothetical protein